MRRPTDPTALHPPQPSNAPPRTQAQAAGRCAQLLLTLGLTLLVGSGCATPRGGMEEVPMGLRDGVLPGSVGRIAILPFAPSDPFGMEPEAQTLMLARYEASAARELGALGFELLSVEELRQGLASDEARAELKRLRIDRPLPELFEPDRRQDGALEDDRHVLLRELGRRLEVRTALVGQVIYHTEAVCQGREPNPYANEVAYVTGPPEGDVRVPCVVSHFEAKLVDLETGRTLWYNRALRELRADAPSAPIPDAGANADATVARVISNDRHGLGQTKAAR